MAKKIEIKKLNKVTILSIVISVVTIAAGIMFIYVPFSNRQSSLRSEILRERDKNVLVGKIRAFDKHLKVYMKRVPQERGVSWLISEVSDMASKEDIEVSSLKPGDPKSIGDYTKYHVVLDVVSTYHQLGKFISRIESSEKFMKIELADIKRLDLDQGFKAEESVHDSYDVMGHLVVSMVTLKEAKDDGGPGD